MKTKRTLLRIIMIILFIAGTCSLAFPRTAAAQPLWQGALPADPAENLLPDVPPEEEPLPEEEEMVLEAALLEEDVIAEGTLGNNCSWQITGTQEALLLEVNGTGAMKGYFDTAEGYPSWKPYKDAITDIVVGEGITAVGSYDFYKMESLKNVTLPESLEAIGIDAFWESKQLETVNFPSGLVFIGAYAFSGCESLNVELTFASDLKEIGANAFYNCINVTGISIPDSVTDIGEAAFSGCTLVNKAILPAGLQVIKNDLFNGCTGLEEIIWPEALTHIYNNAFRGCSGLTEVLIPETMTYIGNGAFEDCTGLTTVSIPLLSYLSSDIFAGCSNLKTVAITKNGMTSIPKNAFLNCEKLEEISLPDTIRLIYEGAFKGCISLTEFPVLEGLTGIWAHAFEGCTSLSAITIPKSMTAGDIKEGAFDGCGNLTIYGYRYTSIEDYAEKNAIPFSAIGEIPIQNFRTLDIEKDISCEETAAMRYTVYPAATSKKNVVWKSSNPKIASVDQNGIVTGHRCGYVYIKVSSTNSDAYKSKMIFVNYKDVPYSAKKNYYYRPVYWANTLNITNGIDGISFGIDRPCTRKQFTIFLWKYSGSPAVSGNLAFNDVTDSKNSASYKAILWANSNGIINGYADGTFRPDEPLTRKHVLLMLYKLAGCPKISGTMPFSDVPYKTTSDSYKAILWGTNHQITSGAGNGLFKPDDSCLRKQVVTFLYRFQMLKYRK